MLEVINSNMHLMTFGPDLTLFEIPDYVTGKIIYLLFTAVCKTRYILSQNVDKIPSNHVNKKTKLYDIFDLTRPD